MARGGQLLTKLSKATSLLAALGMAACARNSLELPPDLGHLPPSQRLLAGDLESPEAKLDCAQLDSESSRIRSAISRNEAQIASNRAYNQTMVYAGGVLFPPFVASARHDDDAKKALDDLQVRSDRVDRLSKARGCPPISAS